MSKLLLWFIPPRDAASRVLNTGFERSQYRMLIATTSPPLFPGIWLLPIGQYLEGSWNWLVNDSACDSQFGMQACRSIALWEPVT